MRRSIVRHALLPLALTFAALGAGATGAPAQAPTAHELRVAEDARARTTEQLATLRAGLAAPAPGVRRIAVRGLGRLRRGDLVPDIAPMLADPSPAVRAAAAIALLDAAASGGAPDARSLLVRRLATERSPAVVGALAEALGWTAHDSAAVRGTAEAIVARSRLSSPAALWGVAHGLFGLARQRSARNALPAPAVARLVELQRHGRGAAVSRRAGEIRELATMALASSGQATERMLSTALDDPDRHVRAAATRGLAGVDTIAAARLARRLQGDRAWQVRALAVGALARRFGRDGCAYYARSLMMDSVVQVRLAAVDALGAGCDGGQDLRPLLDGLAGALPAPRGDQPGAWHLPARALLALAAQDTARARTRIPAFAASPSFFVRDYAARAAGTVGDTATLRRLALDAHPNVRATAIAALAARVGTGATDLYRRALESDDSQLLQAAAAALEGSRETRTAQLLLAALERLTRRGWETDREARLALLERLRAFRSPEVVSLVEPLLSDHDSLVAHGAADLIGAATGTRPPPTPVPHAPHPVPADSTLARLARSRVVIEMEDGGIFAFALFPYEAPTNAARVAALAREGRLDGLTFHRAVIPRFMQGGSPGANEYAGWGHYTRDELGRPNRRGAILMSTRGYDTADGQFVPETADNFEYDHQYTVIGEIVRGIAVVDRMLEGARIRKATVQP